MDEMVLETGIYCNECGWYESESDVEGATCPSCGCARSSHVPAKVIQVGESL